MEFRKAVEPDVVSIMNIIRQAQDYFKENGIDQWQNNYPDPETVKDDINSSYGFVLTEDNKVIGTAAISFDGEKTYESIYNGRWVSNNDYAVIHRMAVDNSCKGKGLAAVIIKYIEKLCLDKGIYSIRVDTHRDNLSMQKAMKKNGFKYCGLIYLEDGSERIAFEKILYEKYNEAINVPASLKRIEVRKFFYNRKISF